MKGWGLVIFPFTLFCAVACDHGESSSATHSQPPTVTYLVEGWSPEERRDFYHRDEGTRLFPYDWFLGLEQRDKTHLFRADDNVTRYRFIPDPPNPTTNQDGLPVGFTRYDPKSSDPQEFACDRDPQTQAPPPPLPQLGFTCAACHTGQIDYIEKDSKAEVKKRHIIYIDGGASMQDNLSFMTAMFDSLKETLVDDKKFSRFAKKVFENTNRRETTPNDLRKCVEKFLKEKHDRAYNDKFKKYEDIFPYPWGFGRLDALGRGGNTLLGKLDPDNLQPANAPVSIPPIWGALNYTWVQWNGAIQDTRARYIAQAIGMNAFLKLQVDQARGEMEEARFQSSVNVKSIEDELVSKIQKLKPPRWPGYLFDKEKDMTEKRKAKQLAAYGKKLYGQLCAHCHYPKLNREGKQEVIMVPLQKIGTDPTAAFNFYARRVRTGILGKKQGGSLAEQTISVAEASQYLTTKIMVNQGLKVKANAWRAPLAYIARPHAGVWATAPFLHNGSVPSLYKLLSPTSERPDKFCVGNLEFDPVEVGYKYRLDECQDGSIFDSTLPGNSNAGHEFRNVEGCEQFKDQDGKNGVLSCELKADERWALIEYLKSL